MSKASVVLLPYSPASVGAARCHLSSGLREAGIHTPAISDAALVVSELLSNALIHATPLAGEWVEVSWALAHGSVKVAVSDGGSATWPHPAFPSLSSVGGRGLAIVDQLASRWGVRSGEVGTTVWAVLPAPGDGGEPPAAGRGNGHPMAKARLRVGLTTHAR